MRIATLGQGFGVPNEAAADILEFDSPPTTIGEAVISSLRADSFNTAQFVVAFATESGILSIETAFKSGTIETFQYVVDTDQQATTRQALEALRATDIDASWIRMRDAAVTFHPKVYHFKGSELTRLIIGSANVTQPGLQNNVEAAVLLEADSDDVEISRINEIKETLIEPALYHSSPLTQTAIEGLDEAGHLGDETTRSFGAEAVDSPAESTSGESASRGVSLNSSPPNLTALASEPEESTSQSTSDGKLPSRNDLPPIPEVDLNRLPTPTDREFYSRLLNGTDNQPSLMRRIIYQQGTITQGELKRRLIDEYEYDDSGSLDASLRVLWRTTAEVEKSGRGPSAKLIWVGME